MNNVERYNDEIKKCRDYLSAIVVAMDELLKKAHIKKNENILKKQKKIFQNLRNKSSEDKFYKFYNVYKNKTVSNLKKMGYEHVSSSKVEEVLRNNTRNFDLSIVSKVESIVSRNYELKDAIMALSSEYNETIKNIQRNKDLIKSEKEREKENQKQKIEREKEYSKPKLTEEQLMEEIKKQQLEKDQERINKNSEFLLAGPKSGGLGALLQGKDTMLKDIEYLYGLAMDIFEIMDMDQKVELKNSNFDKNARLNNAYISSIDNKKSKIDMILKAYGVGNVDALLNKYDKIQKQYYKKFSKLSKEKQEKYNISNFEFYDIKGNFENNADSHLLDAFKNEKFNFPPSKDSLISAMNRRIMNGKNYKLVEPQNQEVITGEAKDFREYLDTKQYYQNLTKNMSVEQIKELYNVVINDMREGFKYSGLESKDIKAYYAIMQKMFGDIIFDKKDMKYLDPKQKDQALKEIIETILETDLDFSVYGSENVTEEEQQKRQLTVEEEYIRYRTQMIKEGKKEYLNFKDFSSQKYNITNVVEPENLEEMLKEEIKGMKR